MKIIAREFPFLVMASCTLLLLMAGCSNEKRMPIDPTVSLNQDTLNKSKAGSKIVFYSSRDGNLEIYAMNADGTGQTRLTFDPDADTVPSWSPNGNKIAFTSDRDGNLEIYVMNADGTNQTRLTTDPTVDALPSWSPNGQKIAFMATRDGNAEIYIMNIDGSMQNSITENVGEDLDPDWSTGRCMSCK